MTEIADHSNLHSGAAHEQANETIQVWISICLPWFVVSEITSWATELTKYFDAIKYNTSQILHVIDQELIQNNLLSTDDFKEYFINAAYLQ